MELLTKSRQIVEDIKNDKKFANNRKKYITKTKGFLFWFFRIGVLIGISYVILGPLIGIIANSFFSDADKTNAMVYIIPQDPTMERYRLAWLRLDYIKVLGQTLFYDLSLMVIQVMVCSMVGYGFARFKFPLKNLLFGCVIMMIVIPTHSIMLPLYVTFQNFDFFGITQLFGSDGARLLGSQVPMYIMSIFGCGLRAGLFIYIFNQFFRGLPKEIEEAAFVDGAGMWYTYFRIMLVNAIPSVITVSIFSMVWQYNDTFFAKLFNISDKIVISKKISSLQATIQNVDKILSPTISRLYLYAGIVLVILPIIIIYVLLQRKFIEGVERSGIVG
jgi:multiple sugar transport system permease protein